jgi:hypothetical protein
MMLAMYLVVFLVVFLVCILVGFLLVVFNKVSVRFLNGVVFRYCLGKSQAKLCCDFRSFNANEACSLTEFKGIKAAKKVR